MRILHYFLGPRPLHDGGLLKYAHDLAVEQVAQGHQVSLLMPGYYTVLPSRQRVTFFDYLDGVPTYQIVNPNAVSIGSGVSDPQAFMIESNLEMLVDYLRMIRPNVIHVHSLIGLPRELLIAAQILRVPTVFTAHDYYGICPKVSLWTHNDVNCPDPSNYNACARCNADAPGVPYLKIRRDFLYLKYRLRHSPQVVEALTRVIKWGRRRASHRGRTNSADRVSGEALSARDSARSLARLSNYYSSMLKTFEVILCGSTVSYETYRSYFSAKNMNANLMIIPLTHSDIKDNRRRTTYRTAVDGKVQLAYMGYLNRIKGFFQLVDTLESLRGAHRNWHLHIYGESSGFPIQDHHSEYYSFHGKYSYEDLDTMFSNISALVVPSEWWETYSFVALEAYSHGVPVLVSSTVGFKDRVASKQTGIVFENSREGLKNALVKVLLDPALLSRFHEAIMNDRQFDELLISTHCRKVEQLYQQLQQVQES